MFSPKKYLPIVAAFVVGVTGAVGYAVHAQSSVPSASNINPQVQTSAQDPKQLDGETADDAQVQQTSAQDPKQLDGETADDTNTSVGTANGSQEAESGPADTGSDTGEIDSGK
jgi:hypothetical protein